MVRRINTIKLMLPASLKGQCSFTQRPSNLHMNLDKTISDMQAAKKRGIPEDMEGSLNAKMSLQLM